MKTVVECNAAVPVILNCWKHHAGFIKSKIQEYRQAGKFDFHAFRENLLRIGDSLMDLYLGELPPRKISDYIIKSFTRYNIIDRDRFILWLKEGGKDYREISLKDNSIWTFLAGTQPERYIHIHPSRYSPLTIRVRALTLKSAILYIILDDSGRSLDENLLFLNGIRKEYLHQPPLKMISAKSALPELIKVLKE
jgi:hypothetical protein